jgi:hypothetical protein
MRFHPVRMFLTVLSPAILLFPGLFLFNSPVFKVVFPQKEPSAVMVKMDAPPPIIMVVFDEFPVTSLMDEYRQIDPIRYPNFAALARDSYWFRNATTVGGGTMKIIPAILSGSYPGQSRIPTAVDYPHNLFTLLGRSYKMKVFESHTMICPEILCGRHQPFTERIQSMLLDLSAVYPHTLLPPDLTAGLPNVRQTWKNFWSAPDMNDVLNRARASYKDRAGLFAKFVESITISDKPTLYFLHIILPHVPWEYLPSGKVYTETGSKIPGWDKEKEMWGEDEWLVTQGYQRHLLQVGFVDKLVGDLLAKLKALNLYDRYLIVITADHGVNFWPNESRRAVLKRDPMGILGVPLFIKAPDQHEGVINDQNVKSIDILPTIMDILDIDLPWPIDGRSALESSLPAGSENVHPIRKKVSEALAGERTLTAKDKSLERKLALFGSGVKPDGLFKIGSHNSLIGRGVSKVSVSRDASVAIELDQSWLYDHVDPKAASVPAYIKGRVRSNRVIEAPFNLAVAINGTIRAVTRTFDYEGGETKFTAMVPETAFRGGKNHVEVFILSTDSDGQLYLMRPESPRHFMYTLYTLSSLRKTLTRHPDGTSIQIVPKALQGFVRSVDRGGQISPFR